MTHAHRLKLEEIGLSRAEAQVYLSLLQHGPSAAAAIASETGLPRTGIYPTLCALADQGLVEGSAGYPSKFAAVSPAEAFRTLMLREKQTLAERQQLADELAESLAPLENGSAHSLDEPVQIIRTPQVIVERFHRLQLEAARQVELVIKGPIINPRLDNPGQQKAQRRGVQYRCLYERSVLEDPKVKPYLQAWIAGGEQARVYDGEIPYKFAIFDTEAVLLILVQRGGQSSALVARHEPLAKSLSMLFGFLWKDAKPLAVEAAKTITTGLPRRQLRRKEVKGPAPASANHRDNETSLEFHNSEKKTKRERGARLAAG